MTQNDWHDIARVEAWAGEIRVNLVRLAAIILFCGRHLFQFVVWPDHSPPAMAYHVRVTWATAVWTAAVLLLHWRLVHRQVPEWLKFASAGFDASMITLLCCIAGSPRSPLVLLFFPLIATAPLRMSLKLVYVTTAAAGLGYLIVLAHYAWQIVGYQKYYATPELRIPRSEEAMHLLAMLVTGLLAGQMVRQTRRMATGAGAVVVAEDEMAQPDGAGVA